MTASSFRRVRANSSENLDRRAKEFLLAQGEKDVAAGRRFRPLLWTGLKPGEVDPLDDIEAVRRDDPAIAYILEGKIKINDKAGTTQVLVPNAIGRAILRAILKMRRAGIPVRLLILKARQLWVSSIIAAYIYAQSRLKQNWNSLIVANEKDSVVDLWEQKYQVMLDNDADEPPTDSDSAKAIKFADTKSRLQVRIGTAKKGRAGTIQSAHITELPYFKDPEKFWAAFHPSVYGGPESFLAIESTGAMHGDFFETGWTAAWDLQQDGADFGSSDDGGDAWCAMFFAWFMHEEYRATVKDKQKLIDTLDDEERRLWLELGASLENLQWRRNKLVGMFGNKAEFRREFPSTPEEAFQGGQGSIFVAQALQWYEKFNVREPAFRAEIVLRHDLVPSVKQDGGGRFWVYDTLMHGCDYLVVGDCAGAEDGDRSSRSGIVVWNLQLGEIAATWSGIMDAWGLGGIAEAIGYWYGGRNAMAVIESNNHGGSAIQRLVQDQYPSVYRRTEGIDGIRATKSGDRPYGWLTHFKNRDMMIDKFKHHIDHQLIGINCRRVFEQLGRFRKIGKKTSGHRRGDDLVICTMIAVMVGSQTHTWSTRASEADYRDAMATGDISRIGRKQGIGLRRIDPEHQKWLNGGKPDGSGQSALSQWWHGSR